jgi:hypothetical protein
MGKRVAKKQKHSYDYVYQYFIDNNCLLLESEYINANTLMKYQCSCGNISKIRFCNFMQGQRCKVCGKEKNVRRGELNWHWNPNLTDEEREKNKRRCANKEHIEWAKAVKKRDNYICAICGVRGGKLASHHLYNYMDYPELRYDIDNGVTIHCEEHDLFHKTFGYHNNTPEQFFMFKNNLLQSKQDLVNAQTLIT